MNALRLSRSAASIRYQTTTRTNPSATLRRPLVWRQSTRSQHTASEENRLPRLVQPSIWESIIPRPLRNSFKRTPAADRKKPSNPANYFIWIYIFIGSQAIRILGLKNEFNTYMRKADLKLAKLREVVQKLQRGEEVDVEKELGTGDELQEREWEEAMEELKSEEIRWQQSKRERRQEEERLAKEQEDANPVNDIQGGASAAADTSKPAMAPQAPGFY